MVRNISKESFSDDVSELSVIEHSEIVLLAVFCHQDLMEDSGVPALTIRDLVREANNEIDTAGILKSLDDQGIVEQPNDSTYRTTIKGLERCIGLLDYGDKSGADDLSCVSPEIRKKVYKQHIENHENYLMLLNEINACYRLGYYTSVAVLIRRLFEDITWQITTSVYDDMDPFLTKDGNPVNFGPNLSQLGENLEPLRGMDPQLDKTDAIEGYLNDIDNLRKLGNRSAHGVKTNLTRQEIDEVSESISRCLEISYSVLKQANQK
ncbi:hypothetical protein [Halosimplex carlsbadense]|uniref:hypothetical protein n=1 Tax=Halosimplex carlsbadense TaxID=171164 RepID=UPI001268AFE6|nr:hypothetical protein [Halosimplex carlsbadense]